MRSQRNAIGVCRLVSVVAVFILFVAPAQAQQGQWSVSLGAVATGDADDPLEGSSGIEASLWRVISRNLDIGLRVGMVKFDSPGQVLPSPPNLVSGEGELTPLELGLRYFPIGSEKTIFPLIGVTVLTPLDDSFEADVVGSSTAGVFLDTDWEVDSVGFGAEAGLRWDPNETVFVEFNLRYNVLGAESKGQVSIPPVVAAEQVVETNLDSMRMAVHVGLYF